MTLTEERPTTKGWSFSDANWTFAFIVLLVLVLPLYLLRGLNGVHDGTDAFILEWVIIAWSGFRLATIAGKGEPRPMWFSFWAFSYIWLGLAGMLRVVAGTVSWPINTPVHDVIVGQACILVGFLFIELGSALRQGSERVLIPNRELARGPVLAVAAYSIVTFPYWVHRLGGLHTLFNSREALQEAAFGATSAFNAVTQGSNVNTGFVTVLSTVPPFLALLGVWSLRRSGVIGKGMGSGALVIALVVVNVVINNPISNPRLWVGTIAVALVFASPLVRSKLMLRLVLIFALFVGLVLFPYAAYFRYSTGYRDTGTVVQSLETSGDYDAFQMITVAAQVAADNGHTDGKQLAGSLLFFVPRSVWPTKATDSGTYMADLFDLPYNNLSAPLWAEMYLDFGFPGIAIVFALYGWVLRRVDDLYLRRPTDFTIIAASVVAGYSFILLRGSLLQAMGRLFGILILLWLMSRSSRTVDASQSSPVSPHRPFVTKA